MMTKVMLLGAIALGLTAQAVFAAEVPPIERIGGRGVEILTASARDTDQGLWVSGLIRRDRSFSRPPATAHLDISALDHRGVLMATTPSRLALLTASLRHRDPVRYAAVIPTVTLAQAGRLQVRYQAKAHAAEGGEGAR
ncbi:hypothetical protein [Caulobacter sp. RHG1]|uniref:hypothetical protein n=1 Tax=Caulobacter sp. (strain RHG1) TaxID=2545762 RepID=UPI001557BF07|nr:hypothetical protein [Caulobacter sp. RHG1]NQE64347.1 hypothetical protein [Caulobacter sp. RHG1]